MSRQTCVPVKYAALRAHRLGQPKVYTYDVIRGRGRRGGETRDPVKRAGVVVTAAYTRDD